MNWREHWDAVLLRAGYQRRAVVVDDPFRENIEAIRRWCIDISREATARDLDDLRVVMPAILDELDRALAGESLAHARVAGPGDAEVIDTELTPVIDELRRGAGR
jgi:hypothetical protein